MASAIYNDSYAGPVAATLIKRGGKFYWQTTSGSCGNFRPFDTAERAIRAAKAHAKFSNVQSV